MATRRFRIKAVANVSVSRGRCSDKPRENEKLDEKTSNNSSTSSDSHEVSPSETKCSEYVSDTTLFGKVSDDSSSKETLENTLVDLVKKSETVSESTCLGANGSDRSTPVDSSSVVNSNIEQYTGSSAVQLSDNCITNESRLCDTTSEGITSSTAEHCLKTEEIIESVKSGDSCVTSPQQIDTTENKIASAPIRLPRKRVKPTVSVSLVNRKAKENTNNTAQQCSSLDKTENAVTYPLFQNSANVSGPTNLEANDNEHSTPVDTASVIDHHLPQDPAGADLQQSGDCDTKDVSLCNETDENITGSTNELPSTAEVSINITRLEDSCVPGGQTVGTTGTEIPAATIRLPRKRVKPAVSLSVINKKVKENLTVENTPVCHSVQNSANVCEPMCLEENDSGSTPVDATNVVSCNLTQDQGYDNIQQSDNCDSKGVSICHRTDENITFSSGEHCSKSKETINSSKSEDSFATSAQVIDTLETKIPAAPIRLPRKRVKPSVSLSVINKMKDNIKVQNTPVYHSVQKPENDSEPMCLEETDSACSTPLEATSIITCNLTQSPGCDNIQQSDNCDSKDVPICNRTNENIAASSGDCSKPEESIDSVSSEDSFATCAQKIDTLETKIPAAPIRLPRKRVKPAVSLSFVNKKVKENLTVENKPVCHSVESSPKVSEPNCTEENESAHFTAVDATNKVTYNLTQDTGYADIQQSDNCDSKHESICNRINEDIKATSGEHCSKNEESIDSVSLEDSFATCTQKIDTEETKVPAAAIRLPRKRVKPAVSLSLVSKKVKENLTVENKPVCHSVQNPPKVSEPTCLEENDGDHSTPVDVTNEVICNLTQNTGYANIQQLGKSDSQDVSRPICNRTNEDITASRGEHCSKTEDSIDSVRSEDLCASSAQKIGSTEVKLSAAPVTLPRKRMKPTVSLSSVNKKVKENCTVELTQNLNASRMDDNSTVEILKNSETSESSSELHEDVEAGGSVRTIPVDGSETPSSVELREVQKSNDTGIVPQTCVETRALQTTVCEPERRNEIPRDISVDAPVGELITSTVSIGPPTCDSSVMNDSLVVGKDKSTSPSVNCSVNQLVKDCSPLNSFRSRFVRPKPLLESAARRNRTGSIGSASESDSEKKSLSSATTVSPPWKPKLKTYRNRLTHPQPLETDKLANASTDESEDERSTISRAATISPPKKITRLDSGSDTSHSEFSQEVSDENSSPVKKSKPEVISKRREYLRRIIEIKKEISHKVSDGRVNKSRLTMFDLIYYNPVTNPMKSVQESNGVKSGPPPTTAPENEKRLAEESVDEPEALEDEEQSSTVPVPQVKVGPNGEIILDEQSLVIETTDAKKNWNDLQNSEVIMDYGNGSSTYNAYSKKRRTRTKDWNREETLRFYRALHTVGTDFLVMQSLFPKFTRKELKDRYKKEERINRELVEKALRNPLTFDLTDLRKEFEQERLEEERRLAQPKKRGMTKRKGGFSRSCSLFATLDSTDNGNKEKPVKRKREELIDITHSQKKRKTDDILAGTESKPKRGETNSKKKQKTTTECAADREETNSKKKRKVGDTRTPSEDAADRKETHSKKKRKTGDTRTTPECTSDSEATHAKKKKKADDARTPSESPPESDTNNAVNGHIDTENIVPEAVSQVKPTRSGRIPRPRIFEDFMTDDVEIYEETEITEICERVTVEDVCNSEPVGDESVEPENVVVDEDTVATYESDTEDQNFVIAEDALTVQQSQVNLGSVYSNVKPGTLIVLATESPDNPGHQIFRVFMVSNNSQTMPVSVPNNQALPTGNNNSVEMNPVTNPVVSESSTNDCNSLQMSAESSS